MMGKNHAFQSGLRTVNIEDVDVYLMFEMENSLEECWDS